MGPPCPGQAARARGVVAENRHAISWPNAWSCMLPWFMTFAQGMFLCPHHLVCGCCVTLSVAYFCAAAGRRGWPAGAGRRGLRHGCCGLGGFVTCVFFQYAPVSLVSIKKCVCLACLGGVAGPYLCIGRVRRGPKCSRPGGAPEICRAISCPNM
jgi:hypothetical protein